MTALVVPDVDCVVLNWKDSSRTLRCLQSLLPETRIRTIFVVDNESDGDLARALQAIDTDRIELIEVPENRGFAGGVNLGMTRFLAGPARFVLNINNDAVLKDEALEGLCVALATSEKIGMVAPIIEDFGGRKLSTGGHFSRLSASVDDLAVDSIDFLTWACVLLRRELVEDIGLLDERFFMYWEDVEFGLRAIGAEWELDVVESAHVLHEISSSHSRAGVKIHQYSAMGLMVLAQKLGGRTWLGVSYRLVGRLAVALGKFDWLRASAVIRGVKRGFVTKRPMREDGA